MNEGGIRQRTRENRENGRGNGGNASVSPLVAWVGHHRAHGGAGTDAWNVISVTSLQDWRTLADCHGLWRTLTDTRRQSDPGRYGLRWSWYGVDS